MALARFALGERVFLVRGALRGAIYNLTNGNVYSVDEEACGLLDACERGIELNEYFTQHPEVNPDLSLAYLAKLCDAGLGRFLEQNAVIEKIVLTQSSKLLDFLWLEVTAGCNLKCVHCYAASSPALIGKDRMRQEDWFKVIRQASALGCRKIQFIGGEPFILGSRLIELIHTAYALEFQFIEVFTNATLIPDTMLQMLQQYKVHVAVSFYSENREVHESITLGKSSHANTVRNIQRILDAHLDLRIAIIGMSYNQDTLETTKQYLRDLGVRNISIDYIRPSGRGYNNDLVPDKCVDKTYLKEPAFPKCSEHTFKQRLFGHNCFSKEVCVTASGDIFPCIMERDISYGNVLDESLIAILGKASTRAIRGLSKDYIEICRDCEYRYACFDCRPKAKNMDTSGNPLAKPKECLYDPYIGLWRELNQK